jgi:Glycosyl hydrolases family 43
MKITMLRSLFLSVAILLPLNVMAAPQFQPGEIWLDTSGQPIQAHGGGILVQSNVYYWYGEDRSQQDNGSVSCYSSTNLYEWKHEGVALSRDALPEVNGHRTFIERPKVIFNPRTKKYVMWLHLEQNGYRFSRAGIAISDSPTGPFTFLQAIRPVANTNDYASLKNDPEDEKDFGGTFRDMNVFVDDDGEAYAFYSSEGNWTMYVVRLNDEFTGPELPAVENKTWAKTLARQMREGPAPFKWNGKYYLITSACTGWAPNAAAYAVADNILGPYQSHGNPCVGENTEKTFDSQSTFVLPAPGKPDSFIFMADRWKPKNLSDSRYIWLPFQLKPDGSFILPWQEHWNI